MAQPIPAPAPAPAPTAAQFANPLPIIGTQYCEPYPVDLSVVRKDKFMSPGNFVVTATNESKNTVIFTAKRNLMTLDLDQRVLLDAAGKPIVTLRQKRMIMTSQQRWNVYRGESKEPRDLIFTVKRSVSMFQRKAKVHVFLANNTKEEVCDFMVQGSRAEKSCVVYTGDHTNIVAQMHKEITLRCSVLTGKDKYSVTVHPNVDHAFIVALIVILDDMNRPS
ncbi:hypothetical protein F2P56_008255 [Juglans regia]|uniref:Protein LURP-one-related 10-like n=2 Tax=Juglans regia TaxID=51240 RepID=A0A2I4EJ34_JUGRE|nr:protein LURP-one-related 10-like [Juglans regia]KAF5471467.1 hypothetical protein F2P56_008255 [Juglans regia]